MKIYIPQRLNNRGSETTEGRKSPPRWAPAGGTTRERAGATAFLLALLAACFLACVSGVGCGPAPAPIPPPAVKHDGELNAYTPDPVVKIKVRRSVAGKYSWDLNGDNVETILETDTRLRERLNSEAK